MNGGLEKALVIKRWPQCVYVQPINM